METLLRVLVFVCAVVVLGLALGYRKLPWEQQVPLYHETGTYAGKLPDTHLDEARLDQLQQRARMLTVLNKPGGGVGLAGTPR